MTPIDYLNVALALVNIALALALMVVYWRNHREIQSRFTLGLVLFAVFLVVHNALFLWHYFSMMESFAGSSATFVAVEGLLQLAAVGTLVAATMR